MPSILFVGKLREYQRRTPSIIMGGCGATGGSAGLVAGRVADAVAGVSAILTGGLSAITVFAKNAPVRANAGEDPTTMAFRSGFKGFSYCDK
jgi:hypothetical protein